LLTLLYGKSCNEGETSNGSIEDVIKVSMKGVGKKETPKKSTKKK
jgi:hypothetical protein